MEIDIQLYNQLLNLATAAQLQVQGLVDDEFVADQVKMTNRAFYAFTGDSLRSAFERSEDKHPHLVEVIQAERERIRNAV